jgi:arabinogalactan oligomer/maltooligosaccharide transport system permease protein
VSRQVLEYVPATDEFKNLVNGTVYRDNGRGNYALVDDKTAILEPGWRAPIWFENYTKILTDPRVREPLVRVFIWTVAFALLTVLTTFALGLLLALALNRPIFGRRIYRSILVLPYAMPSVMSILIWGGMFNTEFGAINTLFGTNIAWFQSATFARVAVILVNLWLGFPYFYLISSGAMQAIPSELSEAAAIDGATPRQIFYKIKSQFSLIKMPSFHKSLLPKPLLPIENLFQNQPDRLQKADRFCARSQSLQKALLQTSIYY